MEKEEYANELSFLIDKFLMMVWKCKKFPLPLEDYRSKIFIDFANLSKHENKSKRSEYYENFIKKLLSIYMKSLLEMFVYQITKPGLPMFNKIQYDNDFVYWKDLNGASRKVIVPLQDDWKVRTLFIDLTIGDKEFGVKQSMIQLYSHGSWKKFENGVLLFIGNKKIPKKFHLFGCEFNSAGILFQLNGDEIVDLNYSQLAIDYLIKFES